MLPDAILSDVFRQISNPQVTCLSNHFAPNSSFGIGCCGIVWRHCTTTHNLDRNDKFSLHTSQKGHTKRAKFLFLGRLKLAPLSFSRSGIQKNSASPVCLSSLDITPPETETYIVRVPHFFSFLLSLSLTADETEKKTERSQALVTSRRRDEASSRRDGCCRRGRGTSKEHSHVRAA